MTKEILLADYTAPAFLIETVDLNVDLQKDRAIVSSRLKIKRNEKAKSKKAPLFLNGKTQKLLSVSVDGRALGKKEYKLTPHDLTIPGLPDKAIVEIVSTHDPYRNTALSGLYASGPMLSTQCEAEGFRRITYYPDRPDVMANFRVTIHADKKRFPILLANGNLIDAGDEGKTRHWAIWEDPFPKPCYLFAMVAGKLDKRSAHFTTKSGRKILIEIYVEPGKTKETDFALAAIKKAMKWDEQRFSLEYDLDRFMMLATPYFNMGAMENKGLNIFNDTCVLGRTETATDATISFIERVVAHEYFHNWTGDRITCRDWFQLSLKEGLTVFREQEYMGDAHSNTVERLDNVRELRSRQFSEDAGALAHSIRPDHYQAIDNFYTATVYEKGAEVLRMIQTLVGTEGFNKGMALYVKRNDGQAVTCEDFVKAMSDANEIDLSHFLLWYKQAGTPVLDVSSSYDEASKKFMLTVEQSCRPTPGQPKKKPLHIPFAVGLLDRGGKDLIGTQVLSLRKAKETFAFENIEAKPVPSLLRNFSAPVRLNYPYSDEELLFLLAHDSDPFNKWEAGFKLATKILLERCGVVCAADAAQMDSRFRGNDEGTRAVGGKGGNCESDGSEEAFIDALGNVLRDRSLDADFRAMVLSLPGENELGLAMQAQGKLIDVDALFAARKALVKRIALRLRDDLAAEHERLSKSLRDTAADGVTMGKRRLKNACLFYLAQTCDPKILKQAFRQAAGSKNMTDQIAALNTLVDTDSPLREKAFAAFDKKWRKVPTVMDKWLAVQAGAKRRDVLKTVRKLMKHPAFTIKNPNRVSALIGVFGGNGLGFHAKDGSGYRFIADLVLELDPINPTRAASLAKHFTRWRDYTPGRQKMMQVELKRLSKNKKLSANTREIVEKSIKG